MSLASALGFKGSSSKTTSYLPSQAKGVNAVVNTYLPTLGQNNNVWQGDRVADLTDLQKSILSSAGNFTSIFGTPQNSTSTPLFSETGTALASLLSGECSIG